MTVTPGDCPGDRRVIPREPAAGAFPTPSETSELSPRAAGASSTPPVSLEPSRLGKFWVLADEDSASSSEEEGATTVSAGAFKYLCRSPSPDAGRDLVESASGLARRAEKRLERQRRQRSAAREFASSCKCYRDDNGGDGFGPARGSDQEEGVATAVIAVTAVTAADTTVLSGAGFSSPAMASAGNRGLVWSRWRFSLWAPVLLRHGRVQCTADARDHGQGQQFSDEFGADFGQFNRGSNNSNFHRNGGNQQYRPRNYGNNFNANYRYGYNGNRSNYNQYRNRGGGNNDAGVQNSANMSGINPELLKEAMQGVVAALAAAAQRGGAEGVASSALGAVASA
ncbi:hypothetical protein ACQ4PT_029469 [Festuca glaucescens]